jgi:hypothetical protein
MGIQTEAALLSEQPPLASLSDERLRGHEAISNIHIILNESKTINFKSDRNKSLVLI